MTTRDFLTLTLSIVFLTARHGAAAPPSYTYCNSCTDCSTKLASGSWERVILSVDIIDHGGSCVVTILGESNVTFDCDGHIIDGDDIAIDPDSGIAMMHGTGNQIVNCTVSDFSRGIHLHNASLHTVAHNILVSNGVGIELVFSNNIDVHDNLSLENFTGIKFDNSDVNTVSSNRSCSNNVYDFHVTSSIANSGTNNVCDVPDGWNDNLTSGCSKTCWVFEDDFESGNTEQWSTAVP
jgi:parallel beta-helix repeat protein